MLEAIHVSKAFKDAGHQTNAVSDVSLSLAPGEICALVGESGSGKSTLARMLCGVLAPTEGEILLDGISLAPPARRKDKSLCKRVQMVLQDGKSSLDPRYSVYNSIAEPLRNLTKISREEEQKRVTALMEKMELTSETARRKSGELSGGQQKRVCIARALATEPQILVFDEAMSGLDVLVRRDILALIKKLHDETRACYLFITHDIDMALYLADRIFVMKDSKLVEERIFTGDIGCFTHPYTKLLLAQTLTGIHRVSPRG